MKNLPPTLLKWLRDGLHRRLAEGARRASEICGGEARGLRQPAAAVAVGSLLPAARSTPPPAAGCGLRTAAAGCRSPRRRVGASSAGSARPLAFCRTVSSVLSILAGASAPALAGDLSWEIEAGFSAVADSSFQAKSFRGEVNETDFGFRAVASKQFGGGPLLRMGVEWQRYDFGLPRRAPLPDTLQSLAVVVGADFQIGEAWLFRLEAMPGFYSGNSEFRFGSLNIPVIVGGSYFVSADLQFVVGIGLDVNRKYPVLGALGLRWKFAPGFVLNAVLPNPRLEYSVSKSLTVYVGADLRETTYRMDSAFGRSRGRRKLDGAIVDHTQIRVGAGASWSIGSHFTLEGEAGIVAVHDFDYHRAEFGVRSSGVPAYGGLSLKAAF